MPTGEIFVEKSTFYESAKNSVPLVGTKLNTKSVPQKGFTPPLSMFRILGFDVD